MLQAIAPKFTGRIWPNGKFGVSRVREAPFPSEVKSHPETEETRWDFACMKVHGIEAALRFKGKWEDVMHPDLSNVPKSPNRSKRGHGGITRYGQNLISSAAVMFERRYSKSLLTFATVTVPPAPRENLLSLHRSWSAVVKQFVKNLRRGLEAKKLPSQVFGVTEIQSRRFETHGEPVLHLHVAFVGRNSKRSAWQVNRKNIRRWWKQAISPYLPAETDYSSVENVSQVRKSVASYLGKYMSKGSSSIEKVIEAGFEEWLPSAWYTITHSLRRQVLSAVLRGENVGNFLNWICHNPLQGWMAWVQPVLIKRSDGSSYPIGFAGRFTKDGLDKIHAVLV